MRHGSDKLLSEREFELLSTVGDYFYFQNRLLTKSDLRRLAEIRALYEKYDYFGHLAGQNRGPRFCSTESAMARFVYGTAKQKHPVIS